MDYNILEDDPDVRAALDWLADASGDGSGFYARLERAQEAHRVFAASSATLGKDPDFSDIGSDAVAAFFAQSKSLFDDRRSYDFALASRVVPWVKQLGRNITLLDGILGARERAARMLNSSKVLPDSALFELVIASNYAAGGFKVEFIEEARGKARSPDLRITSEGAHAPRVVECKRFGRGEYEQDEQARHRDIFSKCAEVIDSRGLSIHIDVTYTQELHEVPDDYLALHLRQALSSPIVTLGSYPWVDEYGSGDIKAANLAAVRADIRNNGALYFGTKLARLLSGRVVRESGYHLSARAAPHPLDPRYIENLYFGSVVTWQCTAPEAIEKKTRYVRRKLVEADEQVRDYGPALVHLAMDAELGCASSDLRRARNFEVITSFQPTAHLLAVYLHYLVPRVSEAHAWLIDETLDTFVSSDELTTKTKIFPGATPLDNDLPAWRQPLSPA